MGNKCNYVLKQKVLTNGLCNRVKKAQFTEYAKRDFLDNGIYRKSINGETVDDIYFEYWLEGNVEDLLEAIKVNNAFYQRLKRLKTRVSNMLNKGHCLFITLTFNDETLNNTTAKQRRVMVSRFLKKHKTEYVANIDFGKKNHREHYHVLLLANKCDLSAWWRFGAVDVEHVRLHNTAKTKLSKYICKLSNHAIKETTKRSACLYSR